MKQITAALEAPKQATFVVSEALAFAIMLAALLIAPFYIYPVFLMKALCFALFACAFNLLIGYVGLLSFGHALFFGWAAYVAAHTAKVWGLTPELAVLAGTAVGAALGFVTGALAIRRQGIYFAMITLALSQMMYFFALQAKFTGGEDGIQAVPRGRLFGIVDLSDQTAMYGFVLVIFLAAFLLIYRIIRSARCSRRSARTSRGRYRLATRPIATSSSPLSCRRRLRVLPVQPRQSCFSWRL
jgi:branched-chain amino acid transport system permease protein